MEGPMTIRRVLLIAAVSAASILAGDSWPQFRGAQATLLPDDKGLPETWSTTENVAWKVEIQGSGWSSPIVWGDRIFVTSAVATQDEEKRKKGLYPGTEIRTPTDEHRWVLTAVEFKTGKILWQREAYRGVPSDARHLKNSYASETPVTDGERVYAYFNNIGVFSYDLNGKPVWSKPMPPVKRRSGWGSGASPALYRGRLYIVNDNDDQSYIEALDAKTGRTVWKVDRNEGTNWSTPFIWENSKRTEIVTAGTNRVRSYDLDGKLLWELAGMSSIVIPTPFANSGLLYVTSGYLGDQLRPTYAIRPGATGDITPKAGETANEYIAWYLPQAGPYNPTPLVYGDYYYTLFDRGFLTCHDAKTGKEIYGKQRIDKEASAFTASPFAYNGKLFLLSEDGDTFVVQAGPEFKVLGKNSLDEMTLATPAFARGSIIVRTASHLFRIPQMAKR
jgi:outer membrane protein assembly factor BamB